MLDTYSKAVLTVIAVALIIIAGNQTLSTWLEPCHVDVVGGEPE